MPRAWASCCASCSPVYGIAIVFVAALAALAGLYLAYETNAPAAGTWAAIAVLFVIQQAVVLGRVFLRVALVGAERQFHITALPKPVPPAVPYTEFVAPVAPDPPEPAEPEPERIPT